jgi:hypothetical protein
MAVRRALWVASIVASSASVSAQTGGDVTAAAAAFQQAQQAQLMRDFARAADLFELADRSAPSAAALRSAIRNHQASGHLARAATLALYAGQRDAADPASAQLSASVRAELSSRLVWVRVQCASPCGIAVDGRADAGERRVEHLFYVDPGTHEISASFEGRPSVQQSLQGEPGARIERTVRPPEVAVPTEPSTPRGSTTESVSGGASPSVSVPSEAVVAPTAGSAGRGVTPLVDSPTRSGLSPVFFSVGVGVTVVLAGVVIWSGLDTLRARDVYVADPTEARYVEGRGLEARTNWLIGATTVAGLGTAALAVVTSWRAPDRGARVRTAAIVEGDRVGLGISGAF